jgi:hypothetical protein
LIQECFTGVNASALISALDDEPDKQKTPAITGAD